MSSLDVVRALPALRLGFAFEERMSGSYHLLSSPLQDRSIQLVLRAEVARLGQFMRDRTARVNGVIDADGLARARPLAGTLGLRLLEQRRLVYDFEFDDDGGVRRRFHGQKDVTLIGLYETMTTLPASLYDPTGAEMGRAVLRFDVRRSMRPFLRSCRLQLRPARTA